MAAILPVDRVGGLQALSLRLTQRIIETSDQLIVGNDEAAFPNRQQEFLSAPPFRLPPDLSRSSLTYYFVLKFLHVVGATVILGTGAGIAFFMLMAHLSRDPAFVGRTAGVVVVADALFTATAIVVQPVTGYLLARTTGTELTDGWVALSLALYLLAGLFWLPVVWMQVRMRDLAMEAARDGLPLPATYHRLFRRWFVFGFPGFGAVLAIVWLMIAKPVLFA